MPMRYGFSDYNDLIWERPDLPRLLIEGDSWVSTPHTENLAQQINRRCELALLNIASPGDEAVAMLAGDQRARLREALRDDDYDFPALLFSAGGNDIVGQELFELLRDLPPGTHWREAVHEERLARRIEQIRLAYLNLIDLRDDYRPGCVILCHGYDFPIPTDTGARVFGLTASGPWMKPYMKLRGITRPADQRALARYLIEQMDTLLTELERDHRDFVYVRTHGTLDDTQWAGEIHPSSPGFRQIARHFQGPLETLFPLRIRLA